MTRRDLRLPDGAWCVVLQFLTELTRLFQKCRLSGSVFITLKKCKQPAPRPGRAGRGREEAGRPRAQPGCPVSGDPSQPRPIPAFPSSPPPRTGHLQGRGTDDYQRLAA